MSTIIVESVPPATATPEEAEEDRLLDVVGLRIPRRRVLATVQLDIDARELPRRKPRVSSQPPYREHLSQAFARFFMRVGLPTDIHRP